jgi:hypothetical protein
MATTLRSRFTALTPVQTYLLALAGFTLVLTSPFTFGHVFVWLGILFGHGWDGLSAVALFLADAYTGFNWPTTHPGISWTATAFVGFNLYVIVGLTARHYKAIFASARRTWYIVLLFVGVSALNLLMFGELPDMYTISAAVTGAGGVPEWLTGIVSLLIFLLASGPIGLLCLVCAGLAFAFICIVI